MMKKLSMFLSLLTIMMIMYTNSLSKDLSMMMNMPTVLMEQMKMPALSFNSNLKSEVFISMVLGITAAVAMYSEIYMEHYNNKKFMMMLVGFFLSMLMLSSSKSIINVMMGWEMLGLSSLLLIMFYPNKTGKYNSIMTMFFNRMGDVILIFVLGVMMLNHMEEMSTSELSMKEVTLLMICALTKSAQFPMSAWLPAAMAAPTPISAMVHSSTLVTAGILLTMKIHQTALDMSIIQLMSMMSMISFLMGGMMSTIESDYKKMVAFSTMSQISMIMLLATSTMITLSLTHMVFHAMFKTLLFCMAGMMFMQVWSKQMESGMELKSSSSVLIKSMLMASIYCMTGILFSSSFYTKDLYLENLIMQEKNIMQLMFLMTAAFMTMMYSIKMMTPMKKLEKYSSFNMKSMLSNTITLLAMTSILSAIFMNMSMKSEMEPMLNTTETLTMMMILMASPMILSKMNNKKKALLNLTNDVAHMKSMMFSMMSLSSKSKNMKMSVENDMMFSKKIFLFNSKNNLKFSSIYFMLLMMMMISM